MGQHVNSTDKPVQKEPNRGKIYILSNNETSLDMHTVK